MKKDMISFENSEDKASSINCFEIWQFVARSGRVEAVVAQRSEFVLHSRINEQPMDQLRAIASSITSALNFTV